MRIKRGENSILTTDFSGVDEELKDWQVDRNLKIEIWKAYKNRILFLEKMSCCDNYFGYNWLIQREIKKLKKQQKHFEVQSMLEFAPEHKIEQNKVKEKNR